MALRRTPLAQFVPVAVTLVMTVVAAAQAHGQAPLRGPPPSVASTAVPRLARPSASSAAILAPATSAPLASSRATEPPQSPAAAPGSDGVHVAVARIRDRRAFEILVRRGGRSPDERATEATKVLERLLEETEASEIRVQVEGDVAVVYGGKSPIVQLGPEDAAAAGDASVGVHAEAVAAKVRSALSFERQRAAIARTVLAFSLLVFSGLMAFLLVRKVSELLERLRTWLVDNPSKLPALRAHGIEVVQPAAVRGSIAFALSGATLVARIGIFYAWVLIALSLFDATRGYSARLTGFVLAPLSALVGRVVVGLPLVVIALVTVLAVGVSLRFVRLLFGSIAHGDTTVGWMPRDLAEPTSILVRAGIVVVTLVVAAPLVTGTDDGTLSRAGVVALLALGLSATPLFACAAVGIAVVFGRRLRVGDVAGVGGREGRVHALTMLEVQIEDAEGCLVHIPHLMSLWQPMRVIGASARITVVMVVDPASDLAAVLEIAKATAATVGSRSIAELMDIDAEGAHLRVAITPQQGADRSALLVALAAALRREGIQLGRRREGVRREPAA